MTEIKMSPLHDRIVIETIEVDDTTSGGVILPGASKDEPSRGKVIAVGEGRYNKKGRRIPSDVKVGDNVIFEKYRANPITIDGKDLIHVRESDIMGII